MNENGFRPKFLSVAETEQKEWKRLLREAVDVGFEHPDLRAFHGTSVEAFQELAKTGILPGRPNGGGAYLFGSTDPVISAFSLRGERALRPEEHQDDESFAELLAYQAGVYAANFAQDHHIFRCLGLSIPEGWRSGVQLQELFHGETKRTVEIFKDRCEEAAAILGCSVDALREAIMKSVERKGIVIAFSKQLFTDFSFKETSSETSKSRDHDHEVVIHCPAGIPARYICGVEPGSKVEWAEVDALLAD